MPSNKRRDSIKLPCASIVIITPRKIKGAKTIVQFDLANNVDARFAAHCLNAGGYKTKIEDNVLYVSVEQHKAVVM